MVVLHVVFLNYSISRMAEVKKYQGKISQQSIRSRNSKNSKNL